jgi:hypothetical protein
MSQKSDAFRTQVTSLAEQFEAALLGSAWSIHRDEKRMRDELGGVYSQRPTESDGRDAGDLQRAARRCRSGSGCCLSAEMVRRAA